MSITTRRTLNCIVMTAITLCATSNIQASVIPTTGLQAHFMADAGISGATVSTWMDQSGNGNHAVAAGVGQEPMRIPAAFMGLPMVRFDGINDRLQNLSYTHGSNDVSLFMITIRNSAPTGYSNLFIGNASPSSASNFYQIYAPNGSHTLNGNFAVNSQDISTGVTYSDVWPQMLSLHKDNSGGGSSEFFIDGSSEGTGTGNQTLADNFFIGSWGVNYSDADFGEILLYNTALSTADRQLVEGSLAWKWGLQASLPDGHPFQFENPNLVPVPEPSSMMLLLGVFGLVVRHRRRRQG